MQRVALCVGLLALSLVAACGVKKATHQKALDELASCQGELSTTRGTVDQQTAQIEKMEAELRTARAEQSEEQQRIAKLVADMKATEQELLDLRKQRDKAQERIEAYRQLNDKFRSLVDTGKLTVAFRNGQMVLELPSGVLFPSGEAALSKAGQGALTEILNVLQEFKDRRFMIAGHTDNVPIRSRRFKDNWDLSSARAVSVVNFMVSQGFSPENLAAAGYGEFAPVAPNDSDDNKQLNRRIEIILVPDLSELPNLTADPS